MERLLRRSVTALYQHGEQCGAVHPVAVRRCELSAVLARQRDACSLSKGHRPMGPGGQRSQRGSARGTLSNQLSGALQTGELRGDAFNSMCGLTPARLIAFGHRAGQGPVSNCGNGPCERGNLTTIVGCLRLISPGRLPWHRGFDGMAVTFEDRH